jgi:hypothetical protein
MTVWRDQIQEHPYPRDLDHIAQEFGPQLDGVSCGVAVVHHGLLLGGLTIPKAALQALFQTHPDARRGTYGYVSAERLLKGLRNLGLEPDVFKRKSTSTPEFLEQLGRELDHGDFAIACIYEGAHWVLLGRWKDGRIRVVDSYDERAWLASWGGMGMYSLTPDWFDEYGWGSKELGWSVFLVRPGIWRKHYEDWLPARDRLLRLAGHPLEATATLADRMRDAARVYLGDDRYTYDQMEFFLSERTSVTVKVGDPITEAVSINSSVADEREGQVAVVRRLAKLDGPPELIFRVSALKGWQLT